MAELTTSTLIKLIIGVIVVVTVIFGVTMSFNNYIKPYFGGLFPSVNETEQINLDKELLKPENLIANVVEEIRFGPIPNINRILGIDGNDDYYLGNGRSIKLTVDGFKRNVKVGFINEQSIVVIEKESNEFLNKLNGATFVESTSGNAFYNKLL